MGKPDAFYGVCFPKQPEMFLKGVLIHIITNLLDTS